MMNFVKKHPLLTAFLIPFFICIIICIGNGVYPFGDYCLLHMDLYHQYLPFYNELWEKLRMVRASCIHGISGLAVILYRYLPIIWRVR